MHYLDNILGQWQAWRKFRGGAWSLYSWRDAFGAPQHQWVRAPHEYYGEPILTEEW
jgi:hypothetical protein